MSTGSKLNLVFLAQVVVKLQCGNEWGSGTIIKRDGSSATIFTNKHLVGSVTTCNVYATTLADSSNPPVLKWTATVSSIHPTADLALLTINNFPSSYPVLLDQNRFCSTSEYTPGQHMTVIGYPATVGGDPTQSTLNISSGDIAGLAGNGLVSKSTAFIDSGSSGGAAISDSNCYFGMPTAVFYRASANELSGLGEIINIAAIINTSTFSFANLTAGNIADYVPVVAAPKPPTPPTPKGTLCNGTYWTACQNGRSFVCPASGDAYCQAPQQDNNSNQNTADIQAKLDAINNAINQQIAAQQAAQDAQIATQQAAQEAARVKQEKLNAINQQIAALNAKYDADISALRNTTGLASIMLPRIQAVTNQYNIDYNALKAEYQQIQYSN